MEIPLPRIYLKKLALENSRIYHIMKQNIKNIQQNYKWHIENSNQMYEDVLKKSRQEHDTYQKLRSSHHIQKQKTFAQSSSLN